MDSSYPWARYSFNRPLESRLTLYSVSPTFPKKKKWKEDYLPEQPTYADTWMFWFVWVSGAFW